MPKNKGNDLGLLNRDFALLTARGLDSGPGLSDYSFCPRLVSWDASLEIGAGKLLRSLWSVLVGLDAIFVTSPTRECGFLPLKRARLIFGAVGTSGDVSPRSV